jgi:hypothetical protein
MHGRSIEHSGHSYPENCRYPFCVAALIRCRKYECAARTKQIDLRFEPVERTGTEYDPLRMACKNKFVHDGCRLSLHIGHRGHCNTVRGWPRFIKEADGHRLTRRELRVVLKKQTYRARADLGTLLSNLQDSAGPRDRNILRFYGPRVISRWRGTKITRHCNVDHTANGSDRPGRPPGQLVWAIQHGICASNIAFLD